MRSNAAVWIFGLAMLCGMLLHISKVAGGGGEAGIIHRGLRDIIPYLRPGQTLYLAAGGDAGPLLIQTRLALAPCNVFLARPDERPDTVLAIGPGGHEPSERPGYRRIAVSNYQGSRFLLFVRRP